MLVTHRRRRADTGGHAGGGGRARTHTRTHIATNIARRPVRAKAPKTPANLLIGMKCKDVMKFQIKTLMQKLNVCDRFCMSKEE